MPINTSIPHFIEKFTHSYNKEVGWQSTPVQIYKLENIIGLIKLPIPLLRADFIHLVLLKKGSYRQQINIKQLDVKDSSIMFIPPGDVFSLKKVSENIAGHLLLVDKKAIATLVNKVDQNKILDIQSIIHLDNNFLSWFNQIFELIEFELVSDKPNRGIINGFLQSIFFQLVKLSEKQSIEPSRSGKIAKEFRQSLNTNITNKRSVEYYATELNVSSNYLNRCVKEVYGKNCKSLILETLILQAQILLFETDKSISEISFTLGFEDQSYFSRVFKKISGMSPLEFRKQ